MATNITLTYKPEMGSPKSWKFDLENPPWDVTFGTEKATGLAWVEFNERLGKMSAVALRALVYVLRKRDEPRLELDAVTVRFSEIDVEVETEEEDEVPEGPKES